MNKKKVLLRATFLLFFLFGCSLFQSASVETPTTLPPTNTPIPTLASIPGIHEPIIVEGIIKKDLGFGTVETKEDLELQILDAIVEENLESGDSDPIYPDDRSNVFLTLKFNPRLSLEAIDWVADNTKFLCGGANYQPEYSGISIGEGGFIESFDLSYVVPGDLNFAECKLDLPGGRNIPLATFFLSDQ